MLAWLGQWLHEVVAVILLAIIVELVLPNKKMLRYTRLVIGLILLLTLLNPILKIFDKEILSNLETSYISWEAQLKSQPLDTQPLEEIQRRGSELATKRDQQSTELVEHTLEDAMKKEVEHQANISVEKLDVDLNWQTSAGGQPTPSIKQVTVTIKDAATSDEHLHSNEEAVEVIIAIEEIKEIRVDNETVLAPITENISTEEAYQQLFNIDANRIISILSNGWNVAANQIIVQARNA